VAERFLRSIRPYVILKSEQVDLALSFHSRIKPGCTPLTKEETAVRENMRINLSLMKGKLNVRAK
jgi:hypothetical protein